MERKKLLLLAMMITTIIFSCIVPSRSSTGSFEVLYSISGTYDVSPGQARVIDEDLSVSYNGTTVILNYYMTSLPYDIDNSMLYLSDGERQSMSKNGHNLSDDWESNPFKSYFGCPMFVTVIENVDYKATFKWHSTKGFLLYAEIEKLHEMQKILRITFKETSIDIYGDLTSGNRQQIEIYKFLVSPAGLITLSIPFFMVIIIACYISNTKKKIRSGARKGRLLGG